MTTAAATPPAPAAPMPHYQGTKTLRAVPMTLGDYNAYRGWTMPAAEDPAAPGYLVEYTDGGKPNDERHAGYISWSPADVFERAYKPCETHVDRMQIELEQLSERSKKLGEFITSSDAFAKLPDVERLDLREQAEAMSAYERVLYRRFRRQSA